MRCRSSQSLWTASTRVIRPTLVDAGSGVWVVAYQKYVNASSAIPCNIVIRFSDDEGVTWTAENTNLSGQAVTGLPNQTTYEYMPLLMVAPNGDLLIHAASNGTAARNGTRQYRSTNGGTTWTDEGNVLSNSVLLGAADWCVSGSTLFTTAFTDPDTFATPPYTPVLLKSTDNGATWSTANLAASGYNEASIDTTPAGTMISVMRADDSTASVIVTSSDGGATWGTPASLANVCGILQKPVTRRFGDSILLSGRRMIGSFSSGDSIYGRHLTELYVSIDSGVTWRGPWTNGGPWRWGCGYTTALQRSNGDIYMLDYVVESHAVGHIVEHVYIPGDV